MEGAGRSAVIGGLKDLQFLYNSIMAQDNGTDRLTRIEMDIEELTKDCRILLRAQVLQADMLSSHTSVMKDLGQAMLESRERMDRMEKAFETRGNAVDTRIDKFFSAIGALAGKVA